MVSIKQTLAILKASLSNTSKIELWHFCIEL